MATSEHLSEETFETALKSTPGPLLVDFWAEWCGPCRVLGPLLERLGREHPEIRIAKVDIDAEPALALRHGVAGIPTVVRYDGGVETLRMTGALPYDRLLAALGIVGGPGRVAA